MSLSELSPPAPINLILPVNKFGYRSLEVVIKVKWDHNGGAQI